MSQNGKTNRLQLPGQVSLGVQHFDGPNAHPAIVPMQQAGGMTVLIFGGMSTLQWAAVMVAAGNPLIDQESAVSKAQALLAACNATLPPPTEVR